MTSLQLDNNQLNGNIPLSLGNLRDIEVLFLRKNQLSSPIPQDIGNLMKLVKDFKANLAKYLEP